ncbi:MAG: sigma-70 family RNA polymerase sigma factor [Clostridiales bacterium]|nr:sigma-70 family RNA polymerase sigma factor [Clostridia bacterium]MCR4563503.1 sigma-70 family RNA polymerase sigma factor [Clostridiales bacterium]
MTTDELVENNLKLVHSLANRFRNRGIEYDDLYSAGCLGLMKAAKGFDEKRGFAFSTYAVPVILGEIKRLFRDGGAVRVSRSLKEKSAKLMRLNEEMAKKLNREPTVSELAEESGLETVEISELLCVAMPPVSLTSDSENEEKQFDVPVESAENEITDRIALNEVLSTLDESDRQLIELRYFKELSQVLTAKQLGISQVQVSRKERKILLELRRKLLE